MKNAMTYLCVVSVIFLGIMLVTNSAFAVGIQGTAGTTTPYGYYNPYGYYGSNSSCGGTMPYGTGTMPYGTGTMPYGTGTMPYGTGTMPYGITPYPQQPTQFCMQWRPPQWIPVQVMIPGRWEYRQVWIPGHQVTLYRPVPGYWQRTNVDGTPDVSVWWTQNGWYASPYQSQASGGYFDSQGVWHPQQQK